MGKNRCIETYNDSMGKLPKLLPHVVINLPLLLFHLKFAINVFISSVTYETVPISLQFNTEISFKILSS